MKGNKLNIKEIEMVTKYTQHFNGLTSQSEPIPGENQIKNNAGGYGYQISPWSQFTRFLILGSEGGSFYVGEKKLTIENAQNAIVCIKEDGVRAVNLITDISENTRAPKNDPAIFALALVKQYGDVAAKKAMYAAIPRVCRIGTHLFQFCDAVQTLGSWSRGLRTAVGNWYKNMPIPKLELQIVKYRQRQGWTHKDVLRLSHPKVPNVQVGDTVPRSAYLKYAVGKLDDPQSLGGMIAAFERINRVDIPVKDAVNAIVDYKLPWETIPTTLLKDKKVWEALIPHMGYTAMLRNLGRMTSCGLLVNNLDSSVKIVTDKLSKPENERVHPMAILLALKTYASGHGFKGSLSWSPVRSIVDTLDQAFYAAFGSVEPTGKRLCLGVDVSGSMYGATIAGTSLDAGTAAGAMALITAAVEKDYEILAYSHELVPLKISPRMRLDDVVKTMQKIPMGGTDCSLPIKWAFANNVSVDAFVNYTDNETWFNSCSSWVITPCGHPSEWLTKYRNKFQTEAKFVEVGFTATNISIADPGDVGTISLVGFDTSTPSVISNFIKGF